MNLHITPNFELKNSTTDFQGPSIENYAIQSSNVTIVYFTTCDSYRVISFTDSQF